MEDDVLGKLVYDHNFEKETEEELDFFGKIYNIRVVLQSYDQIITDEQRKAYVEFKNNYEETIKKLPKVLLDYYLSIYDEYIDAIFNVPEKIDKDHVNEEIVVRTVIPQTLFITKQGKYGLLCKCIWDEEHGTAIIFNGNNVSMGDQDELI